ncbi:MAG: amidohydrolase family protein [Pseudomonadota bacterium]
MESVRTLLADRLFDGERLLTRPLRLEIRDGIVAAMDPLDQEPPSGPGVLDARGRTVLPGLINAHTHIVRAGRFAANDPLSVPQVVRNLRSCLSAGVTAVGDMGCTAGLILTLRDHMARSPESGPAISACGPLVTCPGGYPLDWMPSLYALMGAAVPCPDPGAARAAVGRLVDRGVDHIKLSVMHRSYADRPIPAMPPDVARAVADEAHRLGKKVLAHAHSTQDYQVSLDAGADALMHSSFDPLPPDMVKRVADSGVPVCPTLWVFEGCFLGIERGFDQDPRYTRLVSRGVRREWSRFRQAARRSSGEFPPGTAAPGLSRERAMEALAAAGENFRKLLDARVPMVLGNDSAYGFSLPGRPGDELDAMVRAGMAPDKALTAATKNAAALLGFKDRGRLARGMRADILVVDGKPDETIRDVENVTTVLSGGRPVHILPRAVAARSAAATAAATVAGVAKTVWWARQDRVR